MQAPNHAPDASAAGREHAQDEDLPLGQHDASQAWADDVTPSQQVLAEANPNTQNRGSRSSTRKGKLSEKARQAQESGVQSSSIPSKRGGSRLSVSLPTTVDRSSLLEVLEDMRLQMMTGLQDMEARWQERFREEQAKAEKREQALLKELGQLKVLIASQHFNCSQAQAPSPETTKASAPRSYAAVAMAQAPKESGPLSSPVAELPHLVIDLRQLKDSSQIDLARPAELQRKLEEAWSERDETKAIKIRGLQVRGDKLRVFTTTQEDADTLRRHDGWVRKSLDGARTRGDEWYPIRVDSIHRSTALSRGKISEEFLEAFKAENQVKVVHKASWLSSHGKHVGSLVIYLASAEEADRLLAQKTITVAGQMAFCNWFERLPHPTRCFRCNRYGHFQSRCPNKQACGFCTEEHSPQTCTATNKKCAACGGPHAVTDSGCPTYKQERARLLEASKRLATS